MDFWIAAWRRMRPGISAIALCAMMMNGYYLAGDREAEAILRGSLGTGLVGVPALAVLWILDWCVRGAEARREARQVPGADEDTEVRADLDQR
ncbi:hypothetical protein ACFQS3_05725 [Glycomyces mayteni]|uniref:Uncharacterized protein n=1 Tax=Glycomyces mayteni TaxID=543887 RepID=A0ABW2D2X1_9ACTN